MDPLGKRALGRLAWTLACGAAPLVGCGSPRIDARAAVASLDVGGSVGISASQVTASNDTDALGLGRDDSAGMLAVDAGFDESHLRVRGFLSDHGGEGVLDHDLSKGPVTIPTGTAVDSEFDLGLLSAAWTYDWSTDDAVDAGVGLGVALVDLDAGFTSQANGDAIFTDETVPIPLLAGRLAYRVSRFELALDAAGLAVDFGDDRVGFLDVDLSVAAALIGKRYQTLGGVVLGYRLIHADVEYGETNEDVDASLRLHGPYLGLTLSF